MRHTPLPSAPPPHPPSSPDSPAARRRRPGAGAGRRRGAAGGAAHAKAPDRHRVRRRGLHRRPGGQRVGLRCSSSGGNAVDAAVATAAALGVTEPYSAGIGGGGYFVYYDARTGKVGTIDGRETAPRKMPNDAFIDPATGKPYPSRPSWSRAASRSACPARRRPGTGRWSKWGTLSLRRCARAGDRGSRPAASWSTRPSASRPLDNEERFERLPRDAASCSCPAATPPRSARSSATPSWPTPTGCSAERGVDAFYSGPLARGDRRRGPAAAERARHRPARSRRATCAQPTWRPTRSLEPGADHVALPRLRRLRHGAVVQRRLDRRRGAEHPGALRPRRRCRREQALHPYLEATRSGLRRPRQAYVGDPAYVDVPLPALLSRQVRRRARLPDRPGQGARPSRSRPATLTAYDGCMPPRPARGHGRRGHRERLDHQPHGRRQVGQRRGVHPHHRADRRLRDAWSRAAGSCSTTS